MATAISLIHEASYLGTTRGGTRWEISPTGELTGTRTWEEFGAALADLGHEPTTGQVHRVLAAADALYDATPGAAMDQLGQLVTMIGDFETRWLVSSPGLNLGDIEENRRGTRWCPVYMDGRLLGVISSARGFGWSPREHPGPGPDGYGNPVQAARALLALSRGEEPRGTLLEPSRGEEPENY